MNCQMFSVGLSSGHLGAAAGGRCSAARRGGGTCAILLDRRGARRVRLAPPRWRFRPSAGSSPRYCRREGQALRPCPPWDRWRRRCRSKRCAGRLGRGSCAALGPARVVLFFCPMRASSANQISIEAGSTPFSRAISSRRAGKFFLNFSIALQPGRDDADGPTACDSPSCAARGSGSAWPQ